MKSVVVTGATKGIGRAVAEIFAENNFRVCVCARTGEDLDQMSEAWTSGFPGREILTIQADLSDRSQAEMFGARILEKWGGADVLVNNAGAKILSNYAETDFGVEYHYGVNAVSHFALTMDLLKHRAGNSRVVSVASIIARFAPSKLGPAGSKQNYQAGMSYSASKLANLAFALELENLLCSESFSSLAAHPGFARAEPYGPKTTRFFESFLAQSAKAGARPIVEAATNNEIRGGSYLGPKYLELWGDSASAKIPARLTREQLIQNWKILENLSGKKLIV
jgi:NAD(P)-dependent dehydrogenase (short-subunit alcohol dehydrogenase family)